MKTQERIERLVYTSQFGRRATQKFHNLDRLVNLKDEQEDDDTADENQRKIFHNVIDISACVYGGESQKTKRQKRVVDISQGIAQKDKDIFTPEPKKDFSNISNLVDTRVFLRNGRLGHQKMHSVDITKLPELNENYHRQ